jgi:hypothetical protein
VGPARRRTAGARPRHPLRAHTARGRRCDAEPWSGHVCRRHGARGVGIELDPELVKLAKKGAKEAGVDKAVRFTRANLFKTDLSKATVVTLYLSPSTNLRLRDKLRRELRPGSRIVSHRFDMGDWKPDEERVVGDIHIFLWTIPAR